MNPKDVYYKSSLQPCQQFDLYVVIQHPQRKPPKVEEPSSIDTILSETERFEKEALQRLMDKEQNRPLQVIIKGGRLIILGVAFPIHLLFVMFPKMTFNVVFPSMLFMSKKIANRLQMLSKKLMQTVGLQLSKIKIVSDFYNVLSRSVSNLFKRSAQAVSEAAKEALQKTFSPIKQFVANVRNQIGRGVQFAERSFYALAKPLVSASQKLKSLFENARVAVQERVPSQAEGSAADQLKKKVAALQSGAKRFLSDFKGALTDKGTSVLRLLDSARQGAQRLAKPLADAFSAFTQKAAEIVKKPVEVLVQTLAPKITEIKDLAAMGLAKAFSFLKSQVASVIPLAQHAARFPQSRTLTAKGAVWLKSQLSFIKNCISPFTRFALAASVVLQRLNKEVKAILDEFLNQGKKPFQKAYKSVKKVLKKSVQFITVSIQKLMGIRRLVVTFFKAALHFVRQTWTWVRILVKFAGLLARELFREIQTWTLLTTPNYR